MIDGRHRIHDKIFWFSTIAIAFFLPVSWRVVPALILIMVLNWLIDGRFIKSSLLILREKQRLWTLSFASLYLLYALGLLYTTNFDYGWFDLEVKLSLFIFPLVFTTSPWPLFSGHRLNGILWSFIAGCVTGALILLGHATVNDYHYGIINSFYYMKLGWYFHPSYLSMYFNFAIFFLVLTIIISKIRTIWFAPAIVACALLLTHMVFLLSSKAGIITLIINIFWISGYCLFKLKKVRYALSIIIIGAFIFIAEYFITPQAFSRIARAQQAVTAGPQVNRVKSESNADRIAVWKTAEEIIQHHFLFGVGTGDVKDALLEGYRENNFKFALELKLNAHSQFIQTFVTLGLTGFLLLLATLILPGIRAFRNGQDLYLLFLIIFSVNILFESMLEIQQGVVFYAFFNILLFTWSGKSNQEP